MSYSPRQLKYIVIPKMGIECAIVFNDILDHAEVAGDNKVISAGFCKINPNSWDKRPHNYNSVSVWGFSKTLELTSRPEDAELIEMTLNEYKAY